MASIWPVSLPQSPLLDGFQDGVGSFLLQSSPDMGPRQLRVRYSSGEVPMAATFLMSPSQYITFVDFYELTLRGGLVRFQWVHPLTGRLIMCRIMSVDSPTAVSHRHIRVPVVMARIT